MARKDEIKLLKTFIEDAKKSTDSTTIALGKAAAKILKQKDVVFSALFPIKTKDGFEAHLNINTEKLKHGVISQKVLDGIPLEKALKQKNHPYLNNDVQVVLTMPLGANEDRKREFLQKTTNFYKDLVKKLEITDDGKIHKIFHRSKKGKHRHLLDKYKARNKWIKKRVNELIKTGKFAKIELIFKQVGEEIVSKEEFIAVSPISNPLSPARVRNIYYSK